MSKTFTLTAQKRENSKKSARDTRNMNRVPGVVYGHGFDSMPISVDYSDILKTYRRAGTSALIDLDIDGKVSKVLIHDLVMHPVKHVIDHIDFFVVNLKEKTNVTVPLNFIGESFAVKNLGGILIKAHESLDLRCLPSDIPQEITIDVSKLENIHDHITIADLNLNEKLELAGLDAQTVLCSIAGRAAEKTEAELVAEGAGEEAKKEEKSEDAGKKEE